MLAVVVLQLVITTASCLSTTAKKIPVLYKPEAIAGLDLPQTESKAVRIPIQQIYVNGSTNSTGSRHPQRSLGKRGWGWKHLEDYRGYLYFMDG